MLTASRLQRVRRDFGANRGRLGVLSDHVVISPAYHTPHLTIGSLIPRRALPGAWSVGKDGTSRYLLAVPPIRWRWLSLSRASLAATVFTCTSNSAFTDCPSKFSCRTQAIGKFGLSVRPFSLPKSPVSAASHGSQVLSAIAARKSGRRYRGIRSGPASHQLPLSRKYLAFLRLTAGAENGF